MCFAVLALKLLCAVVVAACFCIVTYLVASKFRFRETFGVRYKFANHTKLSDYARSSAAHDQQLCFLVGKPTPAPDERSSVYSPVSRLLCIVGGGANCRTQLSHMTHANYLTLLLETQDYD